MTHTWSTQPAVQQIPLYYGEPQRSDAGIEQALTQCSQKGPSSSGGGAAGSRCSEHGCLLWRTPSREMQVLQVTCGRHRLAIASGVWVCSKQAAMSLSGCAKEPSSTHKMEAWSTCTILEFSELCEFKAC